jgi:NADPH-dependent curcumin reductase CurA
MLFPFTGPELYGPMISNCLKMQGFLAYQFFNEYYDAAHQLVSWIKDVNKKYMVINGIHRKNNHFLAGEDFRQRRRNRRV